MPTNGLKRLLKMKNFGSDNRIYEISEIETLILKQNKTREIIFYEIVDL
jgi:hypothetical protein